MSHVEPWMRVTFQVARDEQEAVLAWMDEFGALGGQSHEGEDRVRHEVYFDPQQAAAAVQALPTRVSGPSKVTVEGVADGRWEEVYYRGLAPFPLGSRFVIHPGRGPAGDAGEGRLALWIPPGRAFGTGDHDTTRLCLEFLERHVQDRMHVLDVGTGTGILAMAAVLLGASRVVAVDVDREAVAVARENLRRNRLAGRVELVLGTSAAVAASGFDLLAANLRSTALLEGMADLACVLRPGGSAVLSGILAHEAEAVEQEAGRRGLQQSGRRRAGEWLALTVQKRA